MVQCGYQGENLLLIVGCQRSGTTWLQKLLTAHPKVFSGPESYVFDSFLARPLQRWNRQLKRIKEGTATYGMPCYLTQDEFMLIFRDYMLKLLNPMISGLKPGDLFLEKTPDNGFFIPEIFELLPKVRFIHILRDGRDVVASLLRTSRGWGWYWAPKSARKAASMWVDNVTAVREAAKNLPKTQFIEVRYEEMFKSTAFELRRLVDFLNLDWKEEDLLRSVNENSKDVAIKTGGTEISLGGEAERVSGKKMMAQPPGFIGPGCSGSWKHYLSRTEKVVVWKKASKTMDEVGYHWPHPW